MPYDFTYMWNLKNKINEKTEQKQIYRYKEQTDDCQKPGRLGDWWKRWREGSRSTNWQLQNNHRM